MWQQLWQTPTIKQTTQIHLPHRTRLKPYTYSDLAMEGSTTYLRPSGTEFANKTWLAAKSLCSRYFLYMILHGFTLYHATLYYGVASAV